MQIEAKVPQARRRRTSESLEDVSLWHRLLLLMAGPLEGGSQPS